MSQAAGSERISNQQREELVDRIEAAGVPTGPALQNGNGVVISSLALADSVDYSPQGHNGKQHLAGGNGKVARRAAQGVQQGLNGAEPLRVSVSGPELAKVEDLDLADPCDYGQLAECAVSRSLPPSRKPPAQKY